MTGSCRACIGLGANLGDRLARLRRALHELDRLPGTRVREVSSLYRSAPVEARGPDFLNAVALIDTRLDAHALLAGMQAIEALCGRRRLSRNAPRTLDLDLLLYDLGAEGGWPPAIETHDLQVPHPRMHARAFVLAPLMELTPGLRLPGRAPLAVLLAQCDGQVIERIAAPDGLGWETR